MKRFGVAATQGKGADILWIKRLPANGDLWLLRVILAVRRRLKGESSRRQNSRCVLAVPLFPLSKVNLEAIESGEVPGRASEGYPHFLVDCQNIRLTLALPPSAEPML